MSIGGSNSLRKPEGRFCPAEEPRRQRRLQDASLSWGEWFRARYAPYWYVIGWVLVDILVGGFLLQSQPRPTPAWAYLAALAFIAGTIFLAVRIYRVLWPRQYMP